MRLPARRFVATLLLTSASVVSAVSAGAASLDDLPSRFAPYRGARVHYKSLGTGSPAVVFVHGWSGDMGVWRGQVPAVEGRIRALFIDLPGFGRSDKPDVSYTMEYLAGAVDAVMQAARVDRAILVGHSMGTPVIRQFDRKFHAKVVALVAVDGPLRSYFKDPTDAQPFLARFEGPEAAANVAQMIEGMLTPSMDPAARARVMQAARETPPRVASSSMKGMLDPAIWNDDPIRVPALAVMAPNRGWTPEYVDYVKRIAPGIRYETVPGAGHFLMIEKANEFNALLDDFLKSQHLIR